MPLWWIEDYRCVWWCRGESGSEYAWRGRRQREREIAESGAGLDPLQETRSLAFSSLPLSLLPISPSFSSDSPSSVFYRLLFFSLVFFLFPSRFLPN
jgi:hypothetical protein